MEIRSKMYPYPVIISNGDYYVDSSFDVQVDVYNEEQGLRIEFIAKVSNDDIKELISGQKAAYVYHFECSQTGFRKAEIVFEEHAVVKIDKDKVSGKLEICSFVVAIQDIQEFSSVDFNDDYAGLRFDLEKGCILAVGQQCSVDVFQKQDAIRNIKSIFTVIRNVDTTVKEMQIDVTSNYICISLPSKEYGIYSGLNSDPTLVEVLNSVFIVPALIVAIEKIKSINPMDREDNLGDNVWYRSLMLVFKKRYSIDIERYPFEDGDSVKYAQMLINNPLGKALDQLAYSGNEGGD